MKHPRRTVPRLPAYIPPMLSQAGPAFDSKDYLFEIKWDGTRALCLVEKQTARLINRRRIDMTDRYPEFAFLKGLPDGTVLDGEMVVLKDGKSDFGLLQSREQARSPLKIRLLSRSSPASYLVFDLMYLGHRSVMPLPLIERRQLLAELVKNFGQGRMILSEAMDGSQGKALFAKACQQGLEGVMAKRRMSKYLPGKRTGDWIKIKRAEILDCIVIGFLPSGPDDFRSLILASQVDGQLRCVGKVGTGFDRKLRKHINQLLWSNLREKSWLPCKIKGKWVAPVIYCRVTCMERTAGGELRAPAFVELVKEKQGG